MQSMDFPLLMLATAQKRSLAEVLKAVVNGIAQCRDVALTRIWLVAAGDRCGKCLLRQQCPDQSRCLHLSASADNSLTVGESPEDDLDAFNRYPLGLPHIGVVAQTAVPVQETHLDDKKNWILFPDWVRDEKILCFAAQPMQFQDENLGVLEVWDRKVISEEDFRWLRVFANHAAASIANARAFEEIASLKERLELENDYLREEITTTLGAHDIVGESSALKKVLQQIKLVAPTDAVVLINGESGTGKEMVARAIHENSPRKNRALIKVNCGAIPENLFESEFFGHMRGSFTGAVRDKPGRFELADGGTLFLDEIGEIPLAMQAKLLRVLQEQEIERVGDTKTRKVNVRIVAATNRDLKREVAAGRFRQDLFYRLGVFPLEVPPLRERREDIAKLALHFVRLTAKKMNRSVPRFTKAHAEQLAAHDWPGNIRELQNAVERAVILAPNGPLHFELSASNAIIAVQAKSAGVPETPVLTRDDWKRQERENIQSALKQSGGKVFGPDGAAELLNMKPTTLASRIKVLNLKSR